MLVRPSPSESAFGSEESIVKVLLAERVAEVLTVPLVATSANDPAALDASVRLIVAEVPFELTTTFEIVMAGGVKEVITGTASTVKLVLEVAVDVPTVTLMGSVVAPVGTVTVRLFAVAAVRWVAVRLI